MNSYRYIMKSRMDIVFILISLFAAFYVRGYYNIASYILLALSVVTVNALFKLRRM